jgi:hypothetical protein
MNRWTHISDLVFATMVFLNPSEVTAWIQTSKQINRSFAKQADNLGKFYLSIIRSLSPPPNKKHSAPWQTFVQWYDNRRPCLYWLCPGTCHECHYFVTDDFILKRYFLRDHDIVKMTPVDHKRIIHVPNAPLVYSLREVFAQVLGRYETWSNWRLHVQGVQNRRREHESILSEKQWSEAQENVSEWCFYNSYCESQRANESRLCTDNWIFRKRHMEKVLAREHLLFRTDSKLCRNWIQGKSEKCLEEVVAIMKMTAYLYDLDQRVYQKFNEKWKEKMVKEFCRNYGKIPWTAVYRFVHLEMIRDIESYWSKIRK